MIKWIFVPCAAGLLLLWRGVRAVRKSDLLGGLTAADLKYAIDEAKKAELDPPQKSVSGATTLYLEKIKADFPDFHLPEAQTAVELLLREYLQIRFGTQTQFSESNVEDDLIRSIPRTEPPKQIGDVQVHKVTIAGYIKTKEYATIQYQAAVGYRLDEKKHEERYKIESTLKFIDPETAMQLLVCPNCGGVIESTAQKVCAYCGSGIVWDTRLAWRFTSIE